MVASTPHRGHRYAVALALWGLVLSLHLVAPSVMNCEEWAWTTDADTRVERVQSIVHAQTDRSVFQKRMLTTTLVRAFDFVLEDVWRSFLVVEFGLVLLVALILVRIGREIGLTGWESALTQALFFSSHTILFCYFAPVTAFDEPIQFVAFYLVILCILKRVNWAVGPLLLVALLARETTLLLLPGLVGFAYILHRRIDAVYLVGIAFAVAAYFAYLHVFGYTLNDPARIPSVLLHLNFGAPFAALETAFNIFVSLGVPAVVAWYFWRHHRRSLTRLDRAAITAFAITLCVNDPVVFCSAITAEVRQLALPIVFLWPVAGRWLARLLPDGIGRLWTVSTLKSLFRIDRRDLVKVLLAGIAAFTLYAPAYLTKVYQLYAAAFIVFWVLLGREVRRAHPGAPRHSRSLKSLFH